MKATVTDPGGTADSSPRDDLSPPDDLSPRDKRVVNPSPREESCAQMGANALPWGYRYAAVRPDHFRVDYAINPYMEIGIQPDLPTALLQWSQLVSRLRQLGAEVEVLPQRADSPDMVFAMNLGLAVAADDRSRVLMSHMRHPQRRLEGESARAEFSDLGFEFSHVGGNGGDPHFEAGDAFPYAGALVVGFGPRTELEALSRLAAELDARVLGLRITHPRMYHLDLAFCPLDERRALVCPEAFDTASARALLDLVPEPIALSEEEALTFCANSVVVGRNLVMPACPDRVRAALVAAGFDVSIVDVSEFHKAGGSVRCLTNPLDIRARRDLEFVPGGQVCLPAG